MARALFMMTTTKLFYGPRCQGSRSKIIVKMDDDLKNQKGFDNNITVKTMHVKVQMQKLQTSNHRHCRFMLADLYQTPSLRHNMSQLNVII